jgi:AbrB family looped-hinge helix DNA binding protein
MCHVFIPWHGRIEMAKVSKGGLSEEAGKARSVERGQSIRQRLRLGPGGRVVIPAAIRKTMGIDEGDILVASLENGALTIVSFDFAVRQAQEYVRSIVPQGVSLVDELIADRRREAEREERGE